MNRLTGADGLDHFFNHDGTYDGWGHAPDNNEAAEQATVQHAWSQNPDMRVVAHAQIAAVVSPDDGEDLVELSVSQIEQWLLRAHTEMAVGDEILIVRRQKVRRDA